ncbi:flagellar hook-length control protein FliK [Rouxiella sp. Mn2063]|uniref:flagellar hook-length control protein FliK n=1 Tax=Rouxiella sp. Mn2063 TaxID=3395262 RepID=UPI003BC11F45
MMNLDILSTVQNNTANVSSGKTDIKSLLSDVNTPSPADFSTLLSAQTGKTPSADINATLTQLAQKLEAKGQAVSKSTLAQAALADEQDGSLTLNNHQLKQLSDAIEQLSDNNISQVKTSDVLKTTADADKKLAKGETAADSDTLTQPVQALLAMLAAQPQVLETKTINANVANEIKQEQTDATEKMLVVSGKATDVADVAASLLKAGGDQTNDGVDNHHDKNDGSGLIKDKVALKDDGPQSTSSDTTNAKVTLASLQSMTGRQSLQTHQPEIAKQSFSTDSSLAAMQSAAAQPGTGHIENNTGNNPLLQAINQAHNTVPALSTPVTLSAPTQSAVINTPSVPQLNAQLGSSEWQQSLSQQVLMFNRQGQQTAELRLHPEDLGSIQISMKIQDNQAQIHFVSGHSQVRAAIESAMPELRTALADNGISLGQSSVGSDASAWQQQQNGQQAGAQGQGNPASWASHADSNNLVNTSDALPVPAALHSLANGNGAIDTFA